MAGKLTVEGGGTVKHVLLREGALFSDKYRCYLLSRSSWAVTAFLQGEAGEVAENCFLQLHVFFKFVQGRDSDGGRSKEHTSWYLK